MKLIKLVVVAIFALFALACGNTTTVNTPPKASPGPSPVATAAPTPDAMAATREYFSDNCASCHQENGEGGPVKIEGKRLNVPALTKGHALGHSDEELAKQITNGGDGMPAFKDKLKKEEIDNMVKYVRTQFQSVGKKVTDASPATLAPANTDLKKEMPKAKSKD